MRLAAIKSRLALVDERGAIDIEAVSAGRFSPDPQAIYEQWAPFRPGTPRTPRRSWLPKQPATAPTNWAHRFRNRARCSPLA